METKERNRKRRGNEGGEGRRVGKERNMASAVAAYRSHSPNNENTELYPQRIPCSLIPYFAGNCTSNCSRTAISARRTFVRVFCKCQRVSETPVLMVRSPSSRCDHQCVGSRWYGNCGCFSACPDTGSSLLPEAEQRGRKITVVNVF